MEHIGPVWDILQPYLLTPTTAHVAALERVMGSLKGTVAKALVYHKKRPGGPGAIKLTGWVDASPNQEQGNRSRGGTVVMLGRTAIAWSSKI